MRLSACASYSRYDRCRYGSSITRRGHSWKVEDLRGASLISITTETQRISIVTLPSVKLAYHTIIDGLAVGPFPSDPTQVMALQRSGITAVLNVQSDVDFRDRAIQWEFLEVLHGEGRSCGPVSN